MTAVKKLLAVGDSVAYWQSMAAAHRDYATVSKYDTSRRLHLQLAEDAELRANELKSRRHDDDCI